MNQIDVNKLWQNFVDTITNHYADFDGRVGRAQYWYYVLVYFVIGVLVSIVDGMSIHGGLRALYSLGLLVPNIALTTRRLHDTGRPAIWAWLVVVPAVAFTLTAMIWLFTFMTMGLGAILLVFVPFLSLASLAAIVVLIYFCAQPGQTEPNAFGPAPPPWSPGAAPPPAKA